MSERISCGLKRNIKYASSLTGIDPWNHFASCFFDELFSPEKHRVKTPKTPRVSCSSRKSGGAPSFPRPLTHVRTRALSSSRLCICAGARRHAPRAGASEHVQARAGRARACPRAFFPRGFVPRGVRRGRSFFLFPVLLVCLLFVWSRPPTSPSPPPPACAHDHAHPRAHARIRGARARELVRERAYVTECQVLRRRPAGHFEFILVPLRTRLCLFL